MFYKGCSFISKLNILYTYFLNFNYAYYNKKYTDIKINFGHYILKINFDSKYPI